VRASGRAGGRATYRHRLVPGDAPFSKVRAPAQRLQICHRHHIAALVRLKLVGRTALNLTPVQLLRRRSEIFPLPSDPYRPFIGSSGLDSLPWYGGGLRQSYGGGGSCQALALGSSVQSGISGPKVWEVGWRERSGSPAATSRQCSGDGSSIHLGAVLSTGHWSCAASRHADRSGVCPSQPTARAPTMVLIGSRAVFVCPHLGCESSANLFYPVAVRKEEWRIPLDGFWILCPVGQLGAQVVRCRVERALRLACSDVAPVQLLRRRRPRGRLLERPRVVARHRHAARRVPRRLCCAKTSHGRRSVAHGGAAAAPQRRVAPAALCFNGGWTRSSRVVDACEAAKAASRSGVVP
jgi:hypothetical protein